MILNTRRKFTQRNYLTTKESAPIDFLPIRAADTHISAETLQSRKYVEGGRKRVMPHYFLAYKPEAFYTCTPEITG